MNSRHPRKMQLQTSTPVVKSLLAGAVLRAAAVTTQVAVAVVVLAVGSAQAGLILNGDFSANAAQFMSSPGYLGGVNPSAPTDWTFNYTGGSPGINGSDTGVGTPFGPTDCSDVKDFAFIQRAGSNDAFYQTLTLTQGQEYQVTVMAASRGGYGNFPAATMCVLVSAGVLGSSTNYGSSGVFTGNTAEFEAKSFTFTATESGVAYIKLCNISTLPGDFTACYSNVSVNAIPEPSALVLFGAGLSGWLIPAWRKRK